MHAAWTVSYVEQIDRNELNQGGLIVYLTITEKESYSFPALAISGAGIRTPHIFQGAQVACPALRLFLCVITPVMVGRSGGLRPRRVLGAVVRTRSAHRHNEIRTSLVMVKNTKSKEAPMPNHALNLSVIPFEFNSNPLRTVIINDQPWFCAADICKALGYVNSRETLSQHCRQAGVMKRDIRSGGQSRSLTFINEGNLYRLIIKSRKPEAQKFEEWVCDEVLPAIRKHGRYEDSNNQMRTLIGETIGTDGFHCLGAVLDGKVKRLPAPVRKSLKHHIWSQVHKAFSVVSAQDIPADKLDSARNFIAAYAIEGEWIGKTKEEKFTLTEDQARHLDSLLHYTAWVNHRWHQGIGEGVKAINPKLYSSTFEHVDFLHWHGRQLDKELGHIRDHFHRPDCGVRPVECEQRGLIA